MPFKCDPPAIKAEQRPPSTTRDDWRHSTEPARMWIVVDRHFWLRIGIAIFCCGNLLASNPGLGEMNHTAFTSFTFTCEEMKNTKGIAWRDMVNNIIIVIHFLRRPDHVDSRKVVQMRAYETFWFVNTVLFWDFWRKWKYSKCTRRKGSQNQGGFDNIDFEGNGYCDQIRTKNYHESLLVQEIIGDFSQPKISIPCPVFFSFINRSCILLTLTSRAALLNALNIKFVLPLPPFNLS